MPVTKGFEPKTIPAAKLKNGDIIEEGGLRRLIRVRRDSNGVRTIDCMREGFYNDTWAKLPDDLKVRWVGQTNLDLMEYQGQIYKSRNSVAGKQKDKRWWQFWKSS